MRIHGSKEQLVNDSGASWSGKSQAPTAKAQCTPPQTNKKLQEAKAKFQAGLVFKLTKVRLDHKQNAIYTSTDAKHRILLDATLCTVVL